jgi:hypothetical protein
MFPQEFKKERPRYEPAAGDAHSEASRALDRVSAAPPMHRLLVSVCELSGTGKADQILDAAIRKFSIHPR